MEGHKRLSRLFSCNLPAIAVCIEGPLHCFHFFSSSQVFRNFFPEYNFIVLFSTIERLEFVSLFATEANFKSS